MKHKLLLVDDDTILLQFMTGYLRERGFNVEIAQTGAQAVVKVKESTSPYSLAIVDYRMSDKNGAQTTEALLEVNPNLLVLIYSGETDRDAVLLTSRSGACSFVDKKEGLEFFHKEVVRLCAKFESERLTVADSRSTSENERLIATLGMVGTSTAMAEVAVKVAKLREKSGPVLILGESGTGKELVARTLHGNRKGLFKAVNCADYLMSKGTARSELFGHVKGAFTGADSDKIGIFESVNEGSIFLDEVYSLPPEAQVGLLRALQEKVITRLGGTKEVKIRCRVIAAGKPELVNDMTQEGFKPDLYYRISQNVITLPPLRDRKEDIGPLVDYFCSRWSEENNEQKTFLASTISFLERYSWPGNIRELENVVYSVLNTSSNSLIGPKDLGPKFNRVSASLGQGPGTIDTLRAHIEQVEKEYVLEILKKSNGSLKDAAKMMGISPPAVIYLLKKHSLKVKEKNASDGQHEGRQKK